MKARIATILTLFMAMAYLAGPICAFACQQVGVAAAQNSDEQLHSMPCHSNHKKPSKPLTDSLLAIEGLTTDCAVVQCSTWISTLKAQKSSSDLESKFLKPVVLKEIFSFVQEVRINTRMLASDLPIVSVRNPVLRL